MAKTGISNIAVSFLNTVTLFCGIVILASGIWLATKHSSDCVRFLEWPIIVIGIVVVLVSLAGIVGSLTRNRALLGLYMVVMLLAILTLLGILLFTFIVTSGRNGHGVAGKLYKEFDFEDYTDWLRNKVEDRKSWRLITSCIKDADICEDMASNYKTLNDFNNAELSAIETGCCKPPNVCGYQWRGNATTWGSPIAPESDPDCTKWNSSELCFNCDSCKAGLLQQIKEHWRTVAIINVVVLAVMIIAYATAVCAFRNAKK